MPVSALVQVCYQRAVHGLALGSASDAISGLLCCQAAAQTDARIFCYHALSFGARGTHDAGKNHTGLRARAQQRSTHFMMKTLPGGRLRDGPARVGLQSHPCNDIMGIPATHGGNQNLVGPCSSRPTTWNGSCRYQCRLFCHNSCQALGPFFRSTAWSGASKAPCSGRATTGNEIHEIADSAHAR